MEHTVRADERARHWIRTWSRVLGIDTPVRLERANRWSVSDSRGRRGCSLVGVVLDAAGACIYHTRGLIQEDVVHELLHVAHPSWMEREVIGETERLLDTRRESRGAYMQPDWKAGCGRRPEGSAARIDLLSRSSRRYGVDAVRCSVPRDTASDGGAAGAGSRIPGP